MAIFLDSHDPGDITAEMLVGMAEPDFAVAELVVRTAGPKARTHQRNPD